MALEYRSFVLAPGQRAPNGSTGILVNGEILWIGQEGTFPSEIQSTIITVYQMYLYYISIQDSITYNLVEQHMPQWRLNRWRRYYELRLKVKASEVLNQVEQAEYDSFPDPGETHEDCDVYVTPCLLWITDVIAEHKRIVTAMTQAENFTDLEAAKASVNYPNYPGIS